MGGGCRCEQDETARRGGLASSGPFERVVLTEAHVRRGGLLGHALRRDRLEERVWRKRLLEATEWLGVRTGDV